MSKASYKLWSIAINIGIYSSMFFYGLHLSFWSAFTNTHFGNLMVLVVLFLMVIPLRLFVYMVCDWGTEVGNSIPFIAGIVIYLMFHIFPITREVLYFDPSVTATLWTMVAMDSVIALKHIVGLGKNKSPAVA